MAEQDFLAYLRANPYPGRGILLGNVSAPGANRALVVYFLMGRSENSRNRILCPTAEGVCSQSYDGSALENPDLVLYHPLRRAGNRVIVANGDHSDSIRDALLAGKRWEEALESRSFEPDAPHYTPRIAGLLQRNGDYALAILKAADGLCRRQVFSYAARANRGQLIHTYAGEGNPLPSFAGEPVEGKLWANTAAELAAPLWEALHPENRVALLVRTIDLRNGFSDTVVLDRHGSGWVKEEKSNFWRET